MSEDLDFEGLVAPGGTALGAALVQFTGAIAEAFDDICSFGLTVGDSYVPFYPDEDNDTCDDDDDILCSQGWVRVVDVSPAQSAPTNFDGSDTPYIMTRVSLEVGVLRCVPVPEEGELPREVDVLAASLRALDDMNRVLCTALKVQEVEDLWMSFSAGIWSPFGPMGAQHGGLWTFTAEI